MTVALPFFLPHFVAHQQTVAWSAVAAGPLRMEVEYGTVTECKEGGDGARLQVHERGSGSSADFPMRIEDGQLQI